MTDPEVQRIRVDIPITRVRGHEMGDDGNASCSVFTSDGVWQDAPAGWQDAHACREGAEYDAGSNLYEFVQNLLWWVKQDSKETETP